MKSTRISASTTKRFSLTRSLICALLCSALMAGAHPEDPLGSASKATRYLFEECDRQGVLTSEFFLDNKRFLGKIPLKPAPKLRGAFFTADKQAQDLAQLRLKTDQDDTNALFAMALSVGM